jgi:glycosyltransferase involved in cell wall biosynthesis
MKPKVSIIICTKDRPIQLRQMLSSLIAQPDDIEVIVIDDKSTDKIRNLKITQKFSDLLDIKYFFYNKNKLDRSCLYPFREGLDKSSSDWIKFCGDDDYLHPSSVYWELDFINQHKDIDCFMTSYVMTSTTMHPQANYLVKEDINLGDMSYGCWIPDYSLTNKKWWEGVTFREDIGTRWLWVAWREMMYKGMKVKGFPHLITYYYRTHPAQISSQKEAEINNKKLPIIFQEQDAKYL